MRRLQDIRVPRNDTKTVRLSITDVSGAGAGGPTDLLNKTVRWALYPNSRDDPPVLEYTSSDPKLTITDAAGGVVSLTLDSNETSPEYDGYSHYFYVHDGADQWTVATGDFDVK